MRASFEAYSLSGNAMVPNAMITALVAPSNRPVPPAIV
jgi:hypothetical protein